MRGPQRVARPNEFPRIAADAFGTPVRQTMSRAERIRRRGEFQRVYQQGARLQGRYMTIFLLATDLPVSRLGIAATKKIGGSVKRNLAKRLIREVFRRHRPSARMDVVVIPRPNLIHTPFSSLEADYRITLGRHLRAGSPQRGRTGRVVAGPEA